MVNEIVHLDPASVYRAIALLFQHGHLPKRIVIVRERDREIEALSF